ncbi:hypothetical protein ACJIZ3_017638 [Penstemon smallii]|uniref:Uncharacterized protein n=1 Tax=Penstemon smallii TaxID=265156 RepID=A0ABD3SWW2_9LAMI
MLPNYLYVNVNWNIVYLLLNGPVYNNKNLH